MLTRPEAAARLGIHEATLVSWVRHGLVTRHAYNDYASLYEVSDLSPPTKHCSRWDRLTDRVARMQAAQESKRGAVRKRTKTYVSRTAQSIESTD